jgi:SAM-dependent methyltransferase
MTELATPYPRESYAKLASLESGNWWFESRNDLLLWVLANKVRQPINKFLEIGCGSGFVLSAIRRAYPTAELFGSEYHEEGLAHARQRVPDAMFSQLDATRMADRESFDVICAFDVIEHILQDELVLRNLFQALKPGGSVVITVPQHMWLWSATDEVAFHVRRYSRRDMVQKIRSAGLHVTYMTSFVSLLLPVMWLSRRFATGKTENYNPVSEFLLPAWQNKVLRAVMGVEFEMLRAGLRFPAGGSLLIVASKPRP